MQVVAGHHGDCRVVGSELCRGRRPFGALADLPAGAGVAAMGNPQTVQHQESLLQHIFNGDFACQVPNEWVDFSHGGKPARERPGPWLGLADLSSGTM